MVSLLAVSESRRLLLEPPVVSLPRAGTPQPRAHPRRDATARIVGLADAGRSADGPSSGWVAWFGGRASLPTVELPKVELPKVVRATFPRKIHLIMGV